MLRGNQSRSKRIPNGHASCRNSHEFPVVRVVGRSSLARRKDRFFLFKPRSLVILTFGVADGWVGALSMVRRVPDSQTARGCGRRGPAQPADTADDGFAV